MKNTAIALLVVLIIAQPCHAQESDEPMLKGAMPGLVGPVVPAPESFLAPLDSPAPIQTYVTKLKFRDRHPKIYGSYKFVRRSALMASPIVDVSYKVCQIGTFIMQFFI